MNTMKALPLLAPRRAPGVCVDCYTPVPVGSRRCRVCERGQHQRQLAAFAPIAYSVAGESLHQEIACYKREADPDVSVALEHLTLLLDRFLVQHERCVARAAGVRQFDLICAIPSGYMPRPGMHPLERVVVERLQVTADRAAPLLRRASDASRWRQFDPLRFNATRALDGESVLLIDDMWTTGATANSAAAALHRAGAGTVAAVVIARHVKRAWAANDRWLRECAAPLQFERCVHCATGIEQARPGGGPGQLIAAGQRDAARAA